MTNKVVSAPMAAIRTARGELAQLTHWVEVDESGEVVRVLCGRAQPHNILDDSTLFNRKAPDCPRCAGKSPFKSN